MHKFFLQAVDGETNQDNQIMDFMMDVMTLRALALLLVGLWVLSIQPNLSHVVVTGCLKYFGSHLSDKESRDNRPIINVISSTFYSKRFARP